MSYNNSTEQLSSRNFLPKGSDKYITMLALVHDQASSTQSLYYCRDCHSIETYTSVNHHEGHITYTKGVFSGTSFQI